MTPDEMLRQAAAHHAAGRAREAEAAYRKVLALEPDHPHALHLLGVLALQGRQAPAAVDLIRRAIARLGTVPAFHLNLGLALKAVGDREEAARSLERAIGLDPRYVDAHVNLVLVRQEQGRLPEALAALDLAIAGIPGVARLHNLRGVMLGEAGRRDAAERAFGDALACDPRDRRALNNLGNLLMQSGRLGEAVDRLRAAVADAPGPVGADGAGSIQAAGRDNEYAVAYSSLGTALVRAGLVAEACAAFAQALARNPAHEGAWNSRYVAAAYDPERSAADMLAEARACAIRFDGGTPSGPAWDHPIDPERRIRVGFVSADFRHHPVGHFIRAPLAHLDREAVETFCYANQSGADAVTAALRAAADHWRDIRPLGDDEAARAIRDDRIDILVDLAGHTHGNRLSLFARRAAPVQASWIGFPATTGIAAMDWMLADPVLAPAGSEGEFRERVARMPEVAWCYAPPDDAPAVKPPPCLAGGRVTFGSFSFPAKLNERVLSAWAALLHRVPGSRLLLKYHGLDDPLARDRVVRIMDGAGIAADRLTFAGWSPHGEMLAAYGEVDVALDPFPFAGATTTCEALWMGVPVVTLAGRTMAGRTSASFLTAAGLAELVASGPDDYVERAAALAQDRDRLAALRAGLRDRLAASPACDGPRFARALEMLLRGLWRDWCEKQATAS